MTKARDRKPWQKSPGAHKKHTAKKQNNSNNNYNYNNDDNVRRFLPSSNGSSINNSSSSRQFTLPISSLLPVAACLDPVGLLG